MKFRFFSIISFVLIAIGLILFNELEEVKFIPETTQESWCDSQPCSNVNLLNTEFIIVQPSSTIFVYLLGILTIWFGVTIGLNAKNYKSLIWWGRSLVLWGLGALFAGTSYQAFSYEIKCADRDLCLWTSWWEVMYMILTVGSVNCMMVAQSYSCAIGNSRKFHQIYSILNMTIYTIIAFVGAIHPVKFLISFELMIIFLFPSFIIFFVTNIQRQLTFREPMDRRLILIWVSLGFILLIYFLYLVLGITDKLWEVNIWFSENDILHLGLIAWMIFLYHTVVHYVKDLVIS
jgi:hypothetical protein